MARLFTDGDTLSVGAGQIPVATFTQRVVDRLHAEDPRSWRRINAPGPFSDDTVALQVGTSPFNPRTADRYPGSPGICRFKNFSRRGGRAHVTETDHDARRAWTCTGRCNVASRRWTRRQSLRPQSVGYRDGSILATGHKLVRVIHAGLHDRPYTDPGIDDERLVVERNAPGWIRSSAPARWTRGRRIATFRPPSTT